MEDTKAYIALLTNFVSILILIGIFFRYYQYKKKLDVLKELDILKDRNQLTQGDKDFIERNHKEYKIALQKNDEQIKFIYPLFILIAGSLFAFLPLGETLIYLNVLVVAYIYLQVVKLHNKNFEGFLKELKSESEPV